MRLPSNQRFGIALFVAFVGLLAFGSEVARAQQNPTSTPLYEAFRAKDYAKAFQIASEMANENEPTGQIALGDLYSGGLGIPRDDPQAAMWYRKAADQGDAKGEFLLGMEYYKGRGVRKDLAEALAWFRKAAGQGYIPAEVNIGQMYDKGDAVKQDSTEAAGWYRQALEAYRKDVAGADAATVATIAFLFNEGHGTERDYVEAAGLYRTAAERGHAFAQSRLCFLLFTGEVGVARDAGGATKWCTEAAEQGDAWAQNQLGYMYEAGSGTQKDLAQAKTWYGKAAAQGQTYAADRLKNLAGAEQTPGRAATQPSEPSAALSTAMNAWQEAIRVQKYADAFRLASDMAKQSYPPGEHALGYLYDHGYGVKQDLGQAVTWYRKASDHGNVEAQANLATMYDRGEGVQQDYTKAIELYGKSAEQGNAQAQYGLGNLYHQGHGIKQNDAVAASWFEKAAKQGYATAQYNLGLMYVQGVGVARDNVKAIAWFRRAAEQGDSKGQLYFANMYETGRGTPTDLTQAKIWYEKAAAQGDQQAAERLKNWEATTDAASAYLKMANWKPIHTVAYHELALYVIQCTPGGYGFYTVPSGLNLEDDQATLRLLQELYGEILKICQLAQGSEVRVDLIAGVGQVYSPVQWTDAQRCRPPYGSCYYNAVSSAAKLKEMQRRQQEDQQQAAAAEQRRLEAEQTQLNERRVASRTRYDDFVKKAGIEAWPGVSGLTTNPFVYEGKVIAVETSFETMISKDQGVFLGLQSANDILLISSLPIGMFRQKVLVIVTGRVLGKEPIELPMVGKMLVPHLKFVAAHFCQEQNCDEMLLWMNGKAN